MRDSHKRRAWRVAWHDPIAPPAVSSLPKGRSSRSRPRTGVIQAAYARHPMLELDAKAIVTWEFAQVPEVSGLRAAASSRSVSIGSKPGVYGGTIRSAAPAASTAARTAMPSWASGCRGLRPRRGGVSARAAARCRRGTTRRVIGPASTISAVMPVSLGVLAKPVEGVVVFQAGRSLLAAALHAASVHAGEPSWCRGRSCR